MPETRSLKTGCSCKQSLRYIKQVIKSLATAEGKEITLHSFHAALMNDLESTCRAFQQLIFDRHDVIQPIEFIEQRLQRWKSLLASAATCQYTTEVNEREQNTRDYTLSILSKNQICMTATRWR
ncbi:hypothetical protein EB796_005181 [Bugula neritina]|uniref:Uncharacterized protein n=1 Tax=Bugula neritina TaxID=10212 RepID=A0A7J7KE62_BUGNE|nr:hypothetical protein EB796_005181 [Bugula neritina]